jgi:hypothetical protein
MSASEPLMRCRNEMDDVRTGGLPNSRISPRVTCLLLGRRPAKGNADLIQALVWNVGTCSPHAKRETQMGGPHEGESTDAGHGDGPTRSSVEVSVMEMERMSWVI